MNILPLDCHSGNIQHSRYRLSQQPFRLAALGLAISSILAVTVRANEVILPTVNVTSTSDDSQILSTNKLPGRVQDIPQSITVVSKEDIQAQGITRLQDALLNVPGITLNAGEGGAHGDNVNLRGLTVQNGFFLDGIRDIGAYERDSFNEESIEVLKGPSAVLFGRGSSAGIINEVSKAPSLGTVNNASVVLGSNAEIRSTADLDKVFNPTTAGRINLMVERSGVTDRDDVLNRRFGIAPSLAFGIGEPTRLTLNYLHQQENNIPDYGIPFIGGAPAVVARNNYYGLVNYDRSQTDVDVATARLEHDLSDHTTFTNTFRYGHYGFNYLLSAPHLDNDFNSVPPPGTPLSAIMVYRDQPSSSGMVTELVEQPELTTELHTGRFTQTLVTGLELSRETSNVTRYVNRIDSIAPTSLLNPDAGEAEPGMQQIQDTPSSVGTDTGLYAMDTLHLSKRWDLNGGVRLDRFVSNFKEPTTSSAYSRTDSVISPRAAIIYKPTNAQSYYFSYGTSYNPAIEYLTLAPSSSSLAPEKDKTYEYGAKLSALDERLSLAATIFRSYESNLRYSDPDDPTVQSDFFNQRVNGVELGVTGYPTNRLEVTGGYTYLQAKIAAYSNQPDANGRDVPNIAHNSLNLFSTYSLTHGWKVGGGLNFLGHRFADSLNTVNVPSYVVLNALTSYKVNRHVNLQLNIDNITNKLYYRSVYYQAPDENHAVPGAGRTAIFSANFTF